jgi:hypothetical protein
MNLPSVLIALPCYGGVTSAKTTAGLFNLGKALMFNNIEHDILFVSNQSLIPKARSDIANYFLNATNFDILFWIDTDIGFNPDDFRKLYESILSGREYVTATYRHKTPVPKYSFVLETHDGDLIWDDSETAIKISRNVGGFSMVTRSVFEKIAKQYPELKYVPLNDGKEVTERELNNSYHYYDTPICSETGIILPEDFAFQEKCKSVGVDVWMRPDITLIHNGNTDFVGSDFTQIFKKETKIV